MKKNLKYISSLVLAGMLVGTIGATSFAADHVKPTGLGIYNKLLPTTKNVVPYLLDSAEDSLTIKDLKGDYSTMSAFNDKAIASEDTKVTTGDTFTLSNGEKYTVVVYGDAKQDAIVNGQDALLAEKYFAGDAETVAKLDGNEAIKEAVDVVNDGVIDGRDSLAIQKFWALGEKLDVKLEEEKVEYEYEVTINDNNIVNTENQTKSKATIKLKKELEEDLTGAKLVVIKADGKDGTVIASNITIPRKTSEIVVPTASTSYYNLSSQTNYPDGEIKAKLVDSKNNVLTEFTFNKHTKEIATDGVGNVKTDRNGTHTANLTLDTYGDSKVVKMYYVPVEYTDATTPGTAAEIGDFDFEKGPYVDVKDGKVDNQTILTDLKNKKAYDLYYVLEDEYGSRSAVLGPVTITTDEGITSARKVANVKAPELEKEGTAANAKFTWKFEDKNALVSEKFTVTVYKDGKVVGEAKDITDMEISVADLKSKAKVDMAVPGTYKIAVSTQGDTKTTPSEPAESNEVTVGEYKAVQNVKFNYDSKTSTKTLSWESDYAKEDIRDYEVKLYTIDANGNKSNTPTRTLYTAEKSIDITSYVTDTVIYQAEVSIRAKQNQLAMISTDNSKAESEKFFTIGAQSISVKSTTTNSATLNLTPQVNVAGKTTVYTVEVYEVTGEDGWTSGKVNYLTTKTVTVDKKTGDFVVDGLESGKEYAFILVAQVDGVEGKSPFGSSAQGTTKKEMPEITEYKVLDDNSKTGNKEIAKTTNGISIDGVEYTNLTDYDANLTKVRNIVDILAKDDVITYTSEKVTVELHNRSATRAFGATVEGMDLDLVGDGFSRAISTTNGKAPKTVTLSGEAIFNISGLNVATDGGKIVLKSSSDVTGNKAVEVAASSNVKINGVDVTVSKDTKIKATGTKFEVTANDSTNDLTFNNPTGGVEITLVGEEGYGSSQDGAIKITANGPVKVSGSIAGNQLNVKSDLDITVTDGTVDIKNPELAGNKNITVNKTKDSSSDVKVTARANTKAPFALSGIELKEYDVKDTADKAVLDSITGVVDADDDTTAENVAKLNAYLASFGINGTKAKITVSKDSEDITIDFADADKVESQNIKNIK